MPRLTIWAMNDYVGLFDDIFFTEDKQILIDCIMEQSGDLYPFYQVPDLLKKNIENWFLRMSPQFERMFLAISKNYDPLENYDRYEDWNDTNENTAQMSDTTQTNSSGERVDTVSAFNVSTYSPGNKADETNTATTTSNNNQTLRGSADRSGHIHGNIGVTTSTAMMIGEIDARHYDIYKDIANMFEEQFLIQVY